MNSYTFKKLGIIGGMGPLADETFISILNSFCHGGDSGHIPFILDSDCTRPDRSDFLSEKSYISPLNSLKKSLTQLLNLGCTFIVMPCNTAHFWYEELTNKLPNNVTLPSIIKLTAGAAARKAQRVSVLSTSGTRLSGIYSKELLKLGVEEIPLPNDIYELSEKIIFDVKNGNNPDIFKLLHECSKHSDSVILGCTELSRALLFNNGEKPNKLKIIDSLSVLARHTAELYFGCKLPSKHT